MGPTEHVFSGWERSSISCTPGDGCQDVQGLVARCWDRKRACRGGCEASHCKNHGQVHRERSGVLRLGEKHAGHLACMQGVPKAG
jgi:hypothetical protein